MNFKRFNEINFENINFDYHIHSNFTDGENSIEEIFDYCLENQIKNIGISDHIRSTSTYFNEYISKIKNIRKQNNLNCLIGCESKIIKNNIIDISLKDLNNAEYIISSVHRIYFEDYFMNPKDLDYLDCLKQEFKMLIDYKEPIHKNNFIGHPFGMTLKHHKDIDLNYFEEFVKLFSKRKICIEFSYPYHKNFEKEFFDIFKKYNPFLIINSDAHRLNQICSWRKSKFLNSL
tara:strand:+ start:1451 stop:2146 length:696 start_codon:yes stop_codon:yes gene_type:complete